MRKFLLSVFVISVFGIYALFAKSGNPSTVVFNTQTNSNTNNQLNNNDSNTLPITTPPSTAPTVTEAPVVKKVKKTTCSWKYYGGDDEENSRYVCTTTLVDTTPTSSKTTTTTPKPTSTPTTPKTVAVATPPPVVKPKSTSGWNDGTFTGNSIDAYYGYVQVSATISGGRLTNINFLDYPQDRSTSLMKSQMAMTILKSEAINAQSSNVDYVSGATYTSDAFNQSLSSALSKARV
ncbi:MAG: FMN-binding protein [Patescibacteria group bacterium]|nr:FMN-binding protein [Patescibacteria group bacterium]